MDLSGDGNELAATNNFQTEEISNAVGDSFISPYNSPEKDFFQHSTASGDFAIKSKKNEENQQFMANQLPSDATETTHTKTTSTNFQNDILQELKKVSDNTERTYSTLNSGEPIDRMCMNDGSTTLQEIKSDDVVEDTTDEVDLSGSQQQKNIEIATDDAPSATELSSQTGKIVETHQDEEVPISDGVVQGQTIAVMLASAADSTPNNEMSRMEMLSVSKKMEEEFRSMLVVEQQRKKLKMEGASYSPPSETPKTNSSATTKQISSAKDKTKPQKPTSGGNNHKYTSPRRTPTSPTSATASSRPSSGNRVPPKTATPKRRTPTPSSGSPAPRTHIATKSTPTTIRLPTKSPNSAPLGTRTTPAAANVRRQLQTPKTQRTNTTPRKRAQSRLSTALTTTPLKGTRPAISTVRTPKSAPAVRSPGSASSNRTWSNQSERTKARMPDTRNAQSKIGSLQNAKYTPGGGKVKIESKKTDYSKVTSRIGSKANLTHTPQGGNVKIENRKLNFNVSSKCGSLSNMKHTPGGGNVKVEHKKVDFSKVTSKCGSRDNITHTPGGGKVKVQSKKLDFQHVQSKCGSKDNIKHVAQGSNVRIFNGKKDYSRVTGKIGSKDNMSYTPGGGKVKIYHEKMDTSKVQSRIGSKDNLTHTPGGGKVKITHKSLDLSNVTSKCGSMDNTTHVAGGGNVQIFDEKPVFNEIAKSKIGSLDNADHVAGGGNVKIYDEKLSFNEVAAPRTDTGYNGIGSVESTGSVTSM